MISQRVMPPQPRQQQNRQRTGKESVSSSLEKIKAELPEFCTMVNVARRMGGKNGEVIASDKSDVIANMMHLLDVLCMFPVDSITPSIEQRKGSEAFLYASKAYSDSYAKELDEHTKKLQRSCAAFREAKTEIERLKEEVKNSYDASLSEFEEVVQVRRQAAEQRHPQPLMDTDEFNAMLATIMENHENRKLASSSNTSTQPRTDVCAKVNVRRHQHAVAPLSQITVTQSRTIDDDFLRRLVAEELPGCSSGDESIDSISSLSSPSLESSSSSSSSEEEEDSDDDDENDDESDESDDDIPELMDIADGYKTQASFDDFDSSDDDEEIVANLQPSLEEGPVRVIPDAPFPLNSFFRENNTPIIPVTVDMSSSGAVATVATVALEQLNNNEQEEETKNEENAENMEKVEEAKDKHEEPKEEEARVEKGEQEEVRRRSRRRRRGQMVVDREENVISSRE